ncbi:hypothetical protein [Niastella vici]|nr:hypothetical protein [Niastella vici]
MKTKILIYKNGHFYDNPNGQRIELQEGAQIRIEAEENCFIEAQPAGTWPVEQKDSKQKSTEIANDSKIEKSEKILSRGSFLYFKIPHSNKKYEFKVELLEDLYMVKKKNRKKSDSVLYDCTCVTKEEITNNLEFFEEVFAKSLNELHKNTFVHFFGNDGNPACNAIDRFYEKPGEEGLSLRRYRKRNNSEPNLFT